MDPQSQEKLPAASSMPSANGALDEAQDNLERCLTGLDQGGEAGLQASLDRIYPRTGQVRKPIPGLKDSYSIYDYRYPADGSVPKAPPTE